MIIESLQRPSKWARVNYRNASSGGIEATDFSTSLKQYQSHHLELQLQGCFPDKVLPVESGYA